MKKFLFAAIAVVLLSSAVFAGGSKDSGSSSTVKGGKLTLMQNKPEIDAQLKAYAAAWGAANGVTVTIKSIGGTSGGMGPQLKSDYAAGDMPDIFTIDGVESYKEWEGSILDVSDQPWVAKTAVAFKNNGKVFGFPVAIEGYGMAYNADLLAKAGIDPKTLNNYDAYKAAFAKLDGMKKELGIDAVVSMVASVEMGWVTAHHNFNALLSNGLKYDDTSVSMDLLAGKVDAKRLSEYADWVELLFMYGDKSVLATGNYDSQVGAFGNGKTVFLHQGNWVDGNLEGVAKFKMAYAPHGSTHAVTDGIFVAAPSYYVVNKASKNTAAAKKFLVDLVNTPEGNDYMVNKASMVPAFSNVTLQPKGQLTQSVQAWSAAGKVYPWNQYNFTGDFRDKTLTPIYNQFGTGKITKAQFIDLMTKAFVANKK